MRKTVISILAMCVMVPSAAETAVDSIRIDEVVITGTRSQADARNLSQTVTVIGRDDIEENNRLSFISLLNEQVPGMFVTSRGMLGYGVSDGAAGNISMRGLSGSSAQMLVLIDGHPQYAGIFGHPLADMMQSAVAGRIEVLRGPASILYGSNAMGGVVNIVTRGSDADGSHTDIHLGAGSFGTVETQFGNTTRQGRLSSTVSGWYSRTDGHRSNMGFEQMGGYARLDCEISDRWSANASVDVTRFSASQPGPDYRPLEDADQNITRGTASVSIDNSYGWTNGSASLFYNWGDHRINDGYDDGIPKEYRFTSADDMYGVSVWQSAALFDGNRTTIGLDYFCYGGKAANDSLNGRRQTIADRHDSELAGYADFRQNLGSLITVNAGLRIDRHMRLGTQFIPQAGIALHLPAGAEVKLSATRGFRYPTMKEMYMFRSKNPDLEPESLWNCELAFSQKTGNLSYGINLFRIDAVNIIQTVAYRNCNSGAFTNNGVEVSASYRISRSLGVNANYSFLDMEKPLVGSPAHKAYVGAAFDNSGFHAGTGLQYIGGLYSTTDRTQDFLLWNMRASYRLSSILQLWVNLDNILGTKYQINDGYPMPGFNFIAGVNFTF